MSKEINFEDTLKNILSKINEINSLINKNNSINSIPPNNALTKQITEGLENIEKYIK